MSFYNRSPQMGFLPLIMAAMPLIQGAMTGQPLNETNQYAAQEQPTSPLLVAAGVIGGLGLIGGLGYLLWKEK